MTLPTSSQELRLLFILSDDYGEICNTVYFLQGQPFARSTTLLLHSRLYTTNRYGLPGKVFQWKTIKDIITKIKAIKPTIVFLFTGYLFCSNNLFLVSDLAMLLKLLQSMRCHVVTDDPLLGLFSDLKKADLDPFANHKTALAWTLNVPDEHLLKRLARMQQSYLEVWLAVFQLLKDRPHLYTYPSDQLKSASVSPSLTFFNLSLLSPNPQFTQDLNAPYKVWLFVISKIELELQYRINSINDFTHLLSRKLQETLKAGRQPVVIAPAECIQALIDICPVVSKIKLIPFCSYNVFMSLLLEAEYAFFWNILSNSLLVRTINYLPVFFFDPGHMVRYFQPLYSLAVEHYYQGYEPTILDPLQPLDDPRLAVDFIGVKAEAIDQLLLRLKAAANPQQVMDWILSHPHD